MVWTLGFLFFVAHVVAAFHFHHHWSHASALAETARQTRDMIGLEFGAGLYFNHLFTIVWAMDLAWIWFANAEVTLRYPWLRLTWIAYLIFIAFNGVAVPSKRSSAAQLRRASLARSSHPATRTIRECSDDRSRPASASYRAYRFRRGILRLVPAQ